MPRKNDSAFCPLLSQSHLLLCNVSGLLDGRLDVGRHSVCGILNSLARLVSCLLNVWTRLYSIHSVSNLFGTVGCGRNTHQAAEHACKDSNESQVCVLLLTLRAASGSLSIVSWAFLTAGSTSSASSLCRTSNTHCIRRFKRLQLRRCEVWSNVASIGMS